MLTDILSELGLNPSEINVFMVLQERGSLPASKVAKFAGVNRTTAYMILQKLMGRGLIRQDLDSKVAKFSAGRPETLLYYVEEKRKKLDDLKSTIERILPELESLNPATHLPKIQLFEGLEGTINCYYKLLDIAKNYDKKIMRSYVMPANLERTPELYSFIHKKYIKKRVQMGVMVKNITTATEDGIKLFRADKESLRETRLVPLEVFAFNASEINIMGDYFHFLSYGKKRMISVIIHDEEFAATQRAVWDIAWEKAGEEHEKILKEALN